LGDGLPVKDTVIWREFCHGERSTQGVRTTTTMAGSSSTNKSKDDDDDNTRRDAAMKNNDDEDEDDDEDYIPGADPDENEIDDDDDDNFGGGGGDAGASSHSLSVSGRKAADEAFFDLFGYPYQHHQEKHVTISDKATMASAANRRAVHILSTIFGKRSTSTLLSNSKFNAKFARPKDRALSGGMIRLERRVIYETKRFAGREIKVEKVVLVPVFANEVANNMSMLTTTTAAAMTDEAAVAGAATTRGPTKKGGLDNLLAQISRPDKLSTMSKTAADWDMFKSTNVDLASKLEDTAVGNKAYLVKKDFLNRVDTRQFELEKAQRERKRASRR
jgi:hypothetical protein